MSAAKAPPAPMLATLGEPLAGEGWAFEMKWYGQRAVTNTRGESIRL